MKKSQQCAGGPLLGGESSGEIRLSRSSVPVADSSRVEKLCPDFDSAPREIVGARVPALPHTSNCATLPGRARDALTPAIKSFVDNVLVPALVRSYLVEMNCENPLPRDLGPGVKCAVIRNVDSRGGKE